MGVIINAFRRLRKCSIGVITIRMRLSLPDVERVPARAYCQYAYIRLSEPFRVELGKAHN